MTEREKLYQFLGQEANFNNALLVMEHMPGARLYLLDLFWKQVLDSVNAKIAGRFDKWHVEERENQKQWWCLHMYKLAWPPKVQNNKLSIRWSELARCPHLGIWVSHNADCFDWEPFRNGVAGLRDLFQGRRGDIKLPASSIPNWWPVLYEPGVDFNGFKGLSAILPANSGELVDHYAQLMVDLMESVDESLDELVKRYAR